MADRSRSSRRPVGGDGLAHLPADYKLAAFGAGALAASMILPWYGKDFATGEGQNARVVSESTSAISTFTFVEAAVLLVAAGVLALLWYRADGRPFHLPGGDGSVILAAGAWAGLLITWRLFDKPGPESGNPSFSLNWGIFVALAATIAVAVAGNRIRAQHLLEPNADEPPTDRLPRDDDPWTQPHRGGYGDLDDPPTLRKPRR